MTYNPTNLDDVVGFLNKVNKAVYGVAPFTVKVPVRHDVQPENEILPNSNAWCDIGGHKVPDYMLISTRGDASVCENCYDHYN